MKPMVILAVFLTFISCLLTFRLTASSEASSIRTTERSRADYPYIKTAAQVIGYASAVVVEAMTPPELTVPPSITVECSDPTEPDYTGWATATSKCSDNGDNPSVTFEDTVTSGNCPHEKVITRIWMARDNCTNTAASSQIIAVMDTKAPEIDGLAAYPDVLWPTGHRMVPVTITWKGRDNCDPSPQCRAISVESNQPPDACGDANTESDWEITGDLTVNLRAERAECRKEDRIYTITLECADCSGNSSSQAVEVKVNHRAEYTAH